MPVLAQVPVADYVAAGSATFVYPFQILEAVDLLVTVDDATQVLGTDYSLTAVGNPTGGNVVFTVAPTVGAVVVVRRVSVLKREQDYQLTGEFLESAVDRDFDRIWLALQELVFSTGVSITIPPGESGSFGLVLPGAAERANTVFTFGPTGDILLVPRDQFGVDWAALPIVTTVAGNDRIVHYSPGQARAQTITVDNLIGSPLGDGHFTMAAGLVMTLNVPAVIPYNVVRHNTLQRGTFSTGASTYTATATGRGLFVAALRAPFQNGRRLTVTIEKNGVAFASFDMFNEITSGTQSYQCIATGISAFISGDVFRAVALCTDSQTSEAASATCYLGIVEL